MWLRSAFNDYMTTVRQQGYCTLSDVGVAALSHLHLFHVTQFTMLALNHDQATLEEVWLSVIM